MKSTHLFLSLLLLGATLFQGAIAENMKFHFPLRGLGAGGGLAGGSLSGAGPISANITDLECDIRRCMAVVDGQLWGVGAGGYYFGTGSEEDYLVWTDLGLSGVTDVAVGHGHSYALVGGEVFVVGTNGAGAIAKGIMEDERQSWVTTGLTDVVAVHTSGNNGFAITSSGHLFVVGFNSGALGTGDIDNRTTWTNSGLANVTGVAAHSTGTLAIVGGTVYTTGSNSYGELALGYKSTTRSYTWNNTGLNNIVKIASEASSSLAIAADGQLFAVGRNLYGELGLGHSSDVSTWQLSNITNVTDANMWRRASQVISGNELFVAGSNDWGELGIGHFSDVNDWVSTGLTSIDAFSFQTAINDGTLYVTGWNYYGQHGTGVTSALEGEYLDTYTEVTGEDFSNN